MATRCGRATDNIGLLLTPNDEVRGLVLCITGFPRCAYSGWTATGWTGKQPIWARHYQQSASRTRNGPLKNVPAADATLISTVGRRRNIISSDLGGTEKLQTELSLMLAALPLAMAAAGNAQAKGMSSGTAPVSRVLIICGADRLPSRCRTIVQSHRA